MNNSNSVTIDLPTDSEISNSSISPNNLYLSALGKLKLSDDVLKLGSSSYSIENKYLIGWGDNTRRLSEEEMLKKLK